MSDRRYALKLDEAEHTRLRAQAAAGARRETEVWNQLGLGAGGHVADLGCGPGATLLGLVDRVGSSGRLDGVDSDPAAVARAAEDIAAAGATEVVSVSQGLAWDSGLPAADYDVVIVRLVLVHNGGREQAIVDHAMTLLRPGGLLYLFDIDMTMIRVSPPTPPVTELFTRLESFERARGNDVAVGLRLADLLLAAGAELVDYRGNCSVYRRHTGQRGPAWSAREAMVADGYASDDDVARWDREFDNLDAAPKQPWYINAGFTAIGRRRPTV